ncbi:MAG TPA: methyltransferase domain-containing protein [Ktedonobacteraceae bacterium]|nr:methyltransferase domain-containing protein [Ktedonobacteraceae bacterium]
MSQSTQTETSYLLGHSNEEVRRLERQADFVNSLTTRLFETAGIAPGMRVLDVGSGAGDVALLLADYVGPEGSVVGVELNPNMVQLARLRAQAAGLSTISFLAGDINTIALEGEFDAIVGRLVLLYIRDKVAALRHLLEHLRPGGIVAFQDLEFAGMGMSWPPSPLLTRTTDWVREAFRRSGAEPHMGLHLYRLFLDAGLPAPQMELITTVGGGPDWEGYYQLAGVVRTLLPVMLKLGIATEEEVGIETLEQRLREAAAEQHGAATAIGLMSAWTRKAECQ